MKFHVLTDINLKFFAAAFDEALLLNIVTASEKMNVTHQISIHTTAIKIYAYLIRFLSNIFKIIML